MSSVNDAVNSITNLFESGDIRLVVDIAVKLTWKIITMCKSTPEK